MFANPAKILKNFGVREDMVAVDLGAGTGAYSIPLAQMVPRGKVYAIEIQQDFLAEITKKIKEENLDNIECIWGDVEKKEGTKLKDGIADAVIASNVLFQIEDKESFADEIKRILKPDGRLLLIDWSEKNGLPGSRFFRIFPEREARELFETRGFKAEREIDAGSHHYGIILRKP